MMGYATIEEFSSRLNAEKFTSLYASGSDAARQDLEEASAEVNAYLIKRYIVPVTETDALVLLRAWTLDLAVEKAYSRAGGSTVPEKIKERSAVVRNSLRDVSKGVLLLPAAALENPASAGGGVSLDADEPIFTRGKMGGY